MSKVKLIIFDWDDVITLGSKEGYFACYHAALESVGVQLDPVEEHRRILSLWGKHHTSVLKALLSEQSELVEEADRVYRQHRAGGTFEHALTTLPGTGELLKRLSQRYRLAVATGSERERIEQKLMPKFGIPAVFTQILTAYDVPDPARQKPHPYMLQMIMETQGMSTKETVMVGDASSDVLMAQAAGVEPMVVLTGHLNREQAEALGVRTILPSVLELESALTVHGAGQ